MRIHTMTIHSKLEMTKQGSAGLTLLSSVFFLSLLYSSATLADDHSYPGKRPLPDIYEKSKAINYGPYRKEGPLFGELVSETDILQDLKLLNDNDFHLIRTFGTTQDELTLQLAADHYPKLKFQLGIPLASVSAMQGCFSAFNNGEIQKAITLASNYSNVVTVSVGNETQLKGMDVSCLANYIDQVKMAVTQPVTTNQAIGFYEINEGGNPDPILKLVDFVSYHQYPWYEIEIFGDLIWKYEEIEAGPKRAKAMMKGLVGEMKIGYQIVANREYLNNDNQTVTIGSSLPIVIGETGWKSYRTFNSYNREFDQATSNEVNQKWYFDLLAEWQESEKENVPVTIIAFAGMDEFWKNDQGINFGGSIGEGDGGWGFWNVLRQPNYVLCGNKGIEKCNKDQYAGAGYFGAVQETSPNVTVSANKRWNGFLRGANFEFGLPFPVGLLPALFTAPEPGEGELVISQSTFTSPAAYDLTSVVYVQNPDIVGNIVTFSGTCLSNTLTPDYTVEAIIILFDSSAGFAFRGINSIPLTAVCNNSTFSVSIDRTQFSTNDVVQYGFFVTGPQTLPGVDVGKVVIKLENDEFPENQP